MKISTKLEVYELLEKILPKLAADNAIEFIDAQYWLYNECFLSFVPCEFNLNLTSDEIDLVIKKINNCNELDLDSETLALIKNSTWIPLFFKKVKENIPEDNVIYY